VLLAACGGDQAILERICHAFRARLPHHLAALQEALSARDAPRLREAAHKVSGMVAAFSTVAGDVASDLEDHAADGRLDEAAPLLERLDSMGRELMRLADGLTVESLKPQGRTSPHSLSRAVAGLDRYHDPGTLHTPKAQGVSWR
jgi:hypothetical protein